MEDTHARPSEELIKNAYRQLLDSGLSLAKMRDAALADHLLPSHSSVREVVGRSIAWKVAHLYAEGVFSDSFPASSCS